VAGVALVDGRPAGAFLDLDSVWAGAVDLDALTAGQGAYTLALSHYEAVPPQVQQQLASKFQLKDEEE